MGGVSSSEVRAGRARLQRGMPPARWRRAECVLCPAIAVTAPAVGRRRPHASPSVRPCLLVRVCSHPACRARAQAEAPSNPGFTPLITLKRPGTVNATRSPAHPPGAEPPARGGGAEGRDAGGASPARPQVPAQVAGQGSAATPERAESPPHPQPGAASASPLQATPWSSPHPASRRTRSRARVPRNGAQRTEATGACWLRHCLRTRRPGRRVRLTPRGRAAAAAPAVATAEQQRRPRRGPRPAPPSPTAPCTAHLTPQR